ncbi:MAG TPA: hypothetical protein VGK48_28170 [Terriglobia bacterium]|jgi:hypothetical protein
MPIIRRLQLALLIMLIAGFAAGAAAQQNAVPLETVLARASEYVAQYEGELGNLIGAEEYVQSSVWMDQSTPPKVLMRSQRRTSSDFLIIQVGDEWAALRKVNRLDGNKVKQTEPSFDQAFDNSPAGNVKLLDNFKQESTQYNLGDVRRDINLPTFALHVLRKKELSRFSFERAGTAKVGGVQAWKVRFQEMTAPTLVVTGKNQPLYSKGMLWIEPDTGRVLQTEFDVESPSPRLDAYIAVEYGAGKNVKVLVPTSMVERYESASNKVECSAGYSNFRPFEVDVKFEIDEPK